MDITPEDLMLLSDHNSQQDEEETNKKSLKRRRSVDHSWSAEMKQKLQKNIVEGRAGRRRTATACDRCRASSIMILEDSHSNATIQQLKKIACDYTADGCMKCVANGILCYVTDPVTGYSAERCSIPRMQRRIKELEEQVSVLTKEVDRLEAKLVFSNNTIGYLRLSHGEVVERGETWAMGGDQGSVDSSVFYPTLSK
ncbi:hypothetical protein N7495_008238 [Penicillium taxi]|uniref:uncharacterized protein n=1 Tax=Penicillium taxi TaxID=168475 RepID=UPI002545923E|nr:uncharacterized protein N7495_008238 [Penicillium taxi]KAJ5888197.1 hypothetical protein N7495_008238 [Penicillium taxi]